MSSPATEPLASAGDSVDDAALSPLLACAVTYNALLDATVVDTRRGPTAPLTMPAGNGCGGSGHGGTTFYKTGGPWGGAVAGNYNHKYSNWMYFQRCDDPTRDPGYGYCAGRTYLTTKSGNSISGYSANGSGSDGTYIGSDFSRIAARPYCDGSLATGRGEAYGRCYYVYG